MKYLYGVSTAALLAVASTAVLAADKPKGQVEEITVTATRRSESLQKIPVAVKAITSLQLEATGATQLKDLQFSIPNFSFGGNTGNSNRRPDITLRGITSATRVPGFEGSIGFFVDGVYQPFPAQWNNPVIDAERFEVIYGPQDTLFGKNTIAGAVSITSKRPGDKFGGQISAEGGDYNYYGTRGAVDIPIVDGVLFTRVSGTYNSRDGYITNQFDGKKLNDLQQSGGRIQFRFTPSERFEGNLSADAFQELGHPAQGIFVNGNFSSKLPYVSNYNTPTITSRNLYNVRLGLDYNFDNGYKLSSVSAYSALRAWFRTDEDGNPAERWVTNIVDYARTYSQDIRVASPADAKVSFIAGVYYNYAFWAQPGSLQVAAGDPVNPAGGVGQLGPNGEPKYNDVNFRQVSSDSYAVYASGDYHITDRLTARAGVRVTSDNKSLYFPGQLNFGKGFLGLIGGSAPTGFYYPQLPPYKDALTKTAITESGGFDYRVTDGVLAYFKIATGYKAGGWTTDLFRNADPSFNAATYTPSRFRPEYVTSYEVGLKAELFNRRLRSNTAIFYTDYTDKQESAFQGFQAGFRIVNAGKSSIQGIEEQLDLSVTDDFTVNVSVGYQDPKYDDFQQSTTVNLKGKQLIFANKLTSSVGAEYSLPIGQLGDLTLHGDVTYRSRQYLNINNYVSDYTGSIFLANARMTLALKDGRTSVYLYGRNLGDKVYLTSRFAGGSGFIGGGTDNIAYGEPRMIGGGVKYQF